MQQALSPRTGKSRDFVIVNGTAGQGQHPNNCLIWLQINWRGPGPWILDPSTRPPLALDLALFTGKWGTTCHIKRSCDSLASSIATDDNTTATLSSISVQYRAVREHQKLRDWAVFIVLLTPWGSQENGKFSAEGYHAALGGPVYSSTHWRR